MKESYLPKQETLLTELRNWKNTENVCGGVYSDEALKSRSFQRLKMQTYKQLYGKYKGTSLSQDEKALHHMMRHQYKQIEHKLYPNALVRLGMRAWSGLQTKVAELVSGSAKLEGEYAYNGAGLSSVVSAGRSVNAVEEALENPKEQVMGQQQPSTTRWINDLGRKSKKQDNEQHMGLH